MDESQKQWRIGMMVFGLVVIIMGIMLMMMVGQLVWREYKRDEAADAGRLWAAKKHHARATDFG